MFVKKNNKNKSSEVCAEVRMDIDIRKYKARLRPIQWARQDFYVKIQIRRKPWAAKRYKIYYNMIEYNNNLNNDEPNKITSRLQSLTKYSLN